MRSNILLTLFILCYTLTSFTYTFGFEVTHDVDIRDPINTGIRRIQDSRREKREVESLEEEDYPSARNQDEQEEPGFWDRIVKVALKLFNKFIEWLNS